MFVYQGIQQYLLSYWYALDKSERISLIDYCRATNRVNSIPIYYCDENIKFSYRVLRFYNGYTVYHPIKFLEYKLNKFDLKIGHLIIDQSIWIWMILSEVCIYFLDVSIGFFSNLEFVFVSVISAYAHEFAHFITAKKLGYDSRFIVIGIRNIVTYGFFKASLKDSLIFTLAGPCASLLLCIFFFIIGNSIYAWLNFAVFCWTMTPAPGHDGEIILKAFIEMKN